MPEGATQFVHDEARSILETIREKNCAFYSDPRGKGALKDLQQTFPNTWLYVAELLQNAVDEGATRIALRVRQANDLVFEHNGKPFTASDVEALCARGVSAKGANTVGFMGVGFKSVFRSFESVQVSSGTWRFHLSVPVRQGEEYGDQQRDWLGAVLPVWDDSTEAPSTEMTCRFLLANRLQLLPPSAQDLEHVLGEHETLLALLAWQGVKELIWNGRSCFLNSQEMFLNHEDDCRTLLEARDGNDKYRRWMLFSKNYQPTRAAIARFLEHRQITPAPSEKEKTYADASRRRRVAMFCEIGDSGHPFPTNRGSAFALLPTGMTFPIGLHVQADWLLVVTRRELMQVEGNEWHQEILAQFPRLIRHYLEWLTTLEQSGKDWHRA